MNRSFRVLVDGRFLTQPLTGVQRYALQIARRLPELHLAVPGTPRDDYSGIPRERMHVLRTPMPRVAWDQVILPMLARREGILWSPAGIGPLGSVRHVLTVHDLAVLEQAHCYEPAARLYYRTFYPTAARRARAIIAVSEFTKEAVIRLLGVRSENVHVVHHGVSDGFQPVDAAATAPVLSRLGIDAPYFLAVGAVSPRKNYTRLLEAWARSGGVGTTHMLVVIGRSGLRFSGNGKLPAAGKRVRHLASVSDSDLAALYSGAVAFIYPSIYEGFGLPLLEAMACGTPVIASRAAAIPEVGGDAVMLIDPYDVDDLAAAIVRVAEDAGLRDSLRARGRVRCRLFSWDRAAEQIRSILAEAAA